MTNSLIRLKDLNKNKNYAGIRYDIIVDDIITLKNAYVIFHKVIDYIDLFCFQKDQTKDVLEKLEKYMSKIRYNLSVDYELSKISIDNKLYPVRIIMITR